MLGEFQYAYILYGSALLDGDPAVGTSLLRAYLAGVRRYVNGETPQFLDDLAARRMHIEPEARNQNAAVTSPSTVRFTRRISIAGCV